MVYFGCGVCKHLSLESLKVGHPKCAAFPEGLPMPIISGDVFHTAPLRYQKGNEIVYEEREDFKYEFILKNRDRFPDSEFLEPKDYKIIGGFGGDRLMLVGYEDGDPEAALVATPRLAFNTLTEEELHVFSLSSVMAMNPGEVRLYNSYA